VSNPEIIMFAFLITGVLLQFISIGFLYYIGKTRIKEIDKAVLGYEFPNDSIFALGLRVPNYSGGFVSKWGAKRGRLTGKIEHFDSEFKRPFIIYYFLFMGSIFFLLASIFISEIYDFV